MNTFLISSTVALALTSTHLAAGPIYAEGALAVPVDTVVGVGQALHLDLDKRLRRAAPERPRDELAARGDRPRR